MDRYLIDMEAVENLSRAFDTGRPGLVRKIIGEMRLAQIVSDEVVRRLSSNMVDETLERLSPSRLPLSLTIEGELSRLLIELTKNDPGIVTLVPRILKDGVPVGEASILVRNAKWTGQDSYSFTGDTYTECLQLAVEARALIERAESAMTPTPPEKISEMLYGETGQL